MKKKTVDWAEALKPLLKKYKGKKHPLDYGNLYELLVMVVLSAQSSDALINKVAPALFKAYPDMKALSAATAADLTPYINKVIGFPRKAEWLVKIARQIKQDKDIPLTMEGLTALTGIGRKSANVIMREARVPAEGIMVDLHVIRVAPRLGIATGEDPKALEKQMMEQLPQKMWADAGMSISFLGRETCRPTNPNHEDCVMKEVCAFYSKGR